MILTLARIPARSPRTRAALTTFSRREPAPSEYGPCAPRPAKAGDRLSVLSSVYYVRPDGTVVLIDNRMRRPNGIQLSPDGKTLYIADTMLETIETKPTCICATPGVVDR